MQKTHPLDRYAEDRAVAPVMREIARIALAKGYSQQSLASKLGYTPPAIIKHFQTARPSRATIQAYARCLGVSLEYLYLFSKPRKPLAANRVNHWWNALRASLERHERDRLFTVGTTKAVTGALSKIPEDDRLRLLDSFILGEYRNRHLVEGPTPRLYTQARELEYFRRSMSQYFDLNARLRPEIKSEAFLLKLWLPAVDRLKAENANLLLEFAKVLLRRQGEPKSKIEAMTEHLLSDKIYSKSHGRSKTSMNSARREQRGARIFDTF